MIMEGTVIYDGDCSFCRSRIRFLSRHGTEGQFNFLPLRSEEGSGLLRSAGLEESDSDTVVYQRNGRFFTRSTAVLNIFRDLGGWWKLVYGLIIIPPVIRDFFYNLVARNRHRLRAGRRHTASGYNDGNPAPEADSHAVPATGSEPAGEGRSQEPGASCNGGKPSGEADNLQ
jgi:predicted DCC family thiol-disulfide oxidoreductase YuxK